MSSRRGSASVSSTRCTWNPARCGRRCPRCCCRPSWRAPSNMAFRVCAGQPHGRRVRPAQCARSPERSFRRERDADADPRR
jgi:hypothetical protein